ncbi:hypothetical protein GCM10027275_50370 [Rhabdobacter roseus]|uniref:Uncharacterized protein n=1 Tax=Rhabdobacter roseus TaxID=1655419 RepID=A0A840U4U5_9BACT|nr:hypothetical protein [Rhabdobacter roseus]MBB5287110.1 hypothetical protein [Rhabdobacter roseus]
MKVISINGRAFQLPESWTEVPAERLPELLRLLFVLPESGSTYHELLRVLLGYSPKAWRKLMQRFFSPERSEAQRQASAQALAELLRLVGWMRSDDLTAAPFPHLVVDGTPWLLFEEGFATMTYGELADAYIHAQAFVKQLVEGEERLDRLVATLCRPERAGAYQQDPAWNGDRRQDYNEHQARHRAAQLRGRYVPEKILVLVYFMGSLKDFYAHFDLWDDDESAPPRPEDYPGQNLLKNQHLLAEKQIFGSMPATRQANVHEVFQFLEEHRKDVKEENQRRQAQAQD